MNVLVQSRHESLKQTGLDEPIMTNGNGLKIRYPQGCVGSSPSPGTNNLSTKWPPEQFLGALIFARIVLYRQSGQKVFGNVD